MDKFDDFKIFDDFSDLIEFKPEDLIEFGIETNEIKNFVIEYDKETVQKYRILRKMKMDPITLMELDNDQCFKFKYKWDPYTGERLEEDNDGALCFDPDILIKHFYTKRLDKLWVAPIDETQGYYEGYYDDCVGAGEQFYISGRGPHPEWYIFRLPIIDCYLTKDHNKQYITLGPKLTDEEIKEIEEKANLKPNNYKNLFGNSRPSIIEMKRLYDISISKEPSILIDNPSSSEDKSEYARINRDAVNSLINIKG